VDGAGPVVAVEGVLRARGPYASPNNLALLLGRSIAVAAAAALFAAGRVQRLARWVLAPLLLAWLATFSRGGLLFGLPPMLVLLGALAGLDRSDRSRADDGSGIGEGQDAGSHKATARRTATVILGGLLLAGLLMAPFANTERVRGALRLDPGSTGYIRLALWRSAWRMGLDHPWLGVGPDQFLGHYAERYVERGVVQERFLNHPHQLLLDWWTRHGVPGLLLLLSFTGAQAVAFAQAWRRGPPQSRWTIAGAAALLTYGLGHGLVDNHFFLVDLASAAWLAQATLLAALDNREQREERQAS
jgi:O-antigen ligase